MTDVRNIGPIPQIGYGTWQRDGDECKTGVLAAFEAGYRHIDTARGYQNEEHVGQALKDSGLAPSDYWLTTKIGPEYFGAGEVRSNFEDSLEKLGRDKVDLLLIHWPAFNGEYPLEHYLSQFSDMLDEGLCDNLGVSNFPSALFDEAQRLLGDRKIATNQVECHVFLQNKPIVDHVQSKGVPVTAYSPLARGLVKDDPVLKSVGEKHGANEGQVALAYLMAKDIVVIPTSSKPERIAENFKAKDIVLDADDMQAIAGLERGQRLVNPDWAPKWDT